MISLLTFSILEKNSLIKSWNHVFLTEMRLHYLQFKFYKINFVVYKIMMKAWKNYYDKALLLIMIKHWILAFFNLNRCYEISSPNDSSTDFSLLDHTTNHQTMFGFTKLFFTWQFFSGLFFTGVFFAGPFFAEPFFT